MRIRRDGTWTHEYPDSSPTLSGELKSSSLDHGEFGQGRYCCTDTPILQAFCQGRKLLVPNYSQSAIFALSRFLPLGWPAAASDHRMFTSQLRAPKNPWSTASV
jgi:hypothetical protein